MSRYRYKHCDNTMCIMHRIGKNAFQKVVPLRVYPWPRTNGCVTPHPRKATPCSTEHSHVRKRVKFSPSPLPNTHTHTKDLVLASILVKCQKQRRHANEYKYIMYHEHVIRYVVHHHYVSRNFSFKLIDCVGKRGIQRFV